MQIISAIVLVLAATTSARSSSLRARQDDEPVTTYAPCGGFSPNPPKCAYGFQCIEDPRIKNGPTDQPGICVPDDWTECAGFIGLECLPGWGPTECNDWPNDDCDPEHGGADCIGICLYPL